jgi:serine/threonine protein kinase/Tol biopolymer transport system component
MALTIGTQLGSHEITALLGKGGMGEVYRARDLKLKREVAIKILPEEFSRDADRVSRFQREAEVLASLNHPNIAAIHDLEETNGTRYLVLELVEGETLADRIARGPIPVDEALDIAKQIAEALEAAHERGIVHRDLKPANVKITPDGKVKVLDFGLAKALESAPAGATLSNSPTLLSGSTAGMIVGTVAYMAPEQAKGRYVDKRADIFAFGCVLYEMLTGKPTFDGEDVSQVLAHVLALEPDWNRLPASVPSRVRELLRLCLEKNVKNRRSDATDVRLDIEHALKEPATDAAPPLHAKLRARERLAWILAAAFLIGIAALFAVHFREKPPAMSVMRYPIPAPENSTVHSFAISPDGRYVVIAAGVNGKQQLWLRALDALQPQPMAFTEGATYPFWSPDSHYIGFFAQGKLKKVSVSGGASQSLCDVPNTHGGSWSRDDVLIFSSGSVGISIQKVSAAGGTPSDVTKTKGDQRHPVFLPDGRRFLYLVRGAAPEKNGIYVSSLDRTENRRILPDVSGAVFAPAPNLGRVGHILFVRERTLMALPFDAGNAQSAGEVFPVADGVSLTTNGTYVPATVSDTGVLLYSNGGVGGNTTQIAWFDRNGKLLGPVGAAGAVSYPAISPDEKSVAFSRLNGASIDLWLRDLARDTETRLTSDVSVNGVPFWSPKSDRIVFASNRTGGIFNLFMKAASGSGQDESLLTNDHAKLPSQWSRDGRFIVYYEINPKTKNDIWVLPMEGSGNERKPIPFLQTEFSEFMAQLSPDSQWMAYTSDQSGRREVYVRPFPAAEGQWTISVAGGQAPRWRGDGKELFFEAADGKMMAVPVKASGGPKPTFEAGTPAALFDAHIEHRIVDSNSEYDVTADGKRFLINTVSGPTAASSPPLIVVVNWNVESKK